MSFLKQKENGLISSVVIELKKKKTQTNVHLKESFNHTESYALFQFKKDPNLSFKWT